jgi:excinuclease ABC subunit B
MRRAMAETERRRARQMAFNQANGIRPRGIVKQVRELIEGVYDPQQARQELQAAEQQADYAQMGEKGLSREIRQLEKQMLEHARNLEFEKAAQIRDRLARLKHQVFGSSGSGNLVPLVTGRAA